MATGAGVRRIVVGVDGSEHSAAALQWAIRMARGMGSQITAVYAVHVPVYFPEPYGVALQFDEQWRSEITTEFETNWCEPLRLAGVTFSTVILDGRPADVIAAVAEEVDADVVVVGRRGRGGVAELVLGSVSHELAVHCRRPLLLIEPELERQPRAAHSLSVVQEKPAHVR